MRAPGVGWYDTAEEVDIAFVLGNNPILPTVGTSLTQQPQHSRVIPMSPPHLGQDGGTNTSTAVCSICCFLGAYGEAVFASTPYLPLCLSLSPLSLCVCLVICSLSLQHCTSPSGPRFLPLHLHHDSNRPTSQRAT